MKNVLNVAKTPYQFINNSGKAFNSSPLDFKDSGIDKLVLNSYNSFEVHTSSDLPTLMASLKNSNPGLNFGIIGDSFYDEEKSELINKPDEPIWELSEIGNGCFKVSRT